MFTCRFLRRYSLDVRAATPRLDSLRSRLERGPGLDEFASGTTTPEQQKPITAAERRRANHVRLPEWLKTAPPVGRNYQRIKSDLAKLNLSTVCVEAKCPNIGECWGGTDSGTATATIMLMGDECTRGCRFCSVKTSRAPAALDENEPMNTSEAVSRWGLDYVVLTSVDRDDLPDGGASHFAKTVRLLKEKSPSILVECLTGDYQGNSEHVALVANSGLDVYTHNVETVERLTPYVRDRRAGYRQSLGVLEHAKKTRPTLVTKSSIMVGCGETFEEILQTFRDLRSAGVEAVTLGQYMRPTTRHMKVVEYVHPDVFKQYETEARQAGFRVVASGPLVRSSYKAAEFYLRDLVRGAQRKASPQLQAGASAVADGRHSIA